ncbi:MAG: anion permease, partial [Chloroflexi bacterium]
MLDVALSPLALTIVVTALIFDFLNGFHDSSNLVATAISSHALSPRRALLIAAAAEFAGPFLFGVAVATTIGHEVVVEQAITLPVIWAALLAAIFWDILTWFFGIPSSSSHALVGGIIGAVLIRSGQSALRQQGLVKVITALLISPPVGLLVGYFLMRLTLFLARGFSPRINWFFKRGQLLTVLSLALSHGTNDAQKTMGVIAMVLLADGVIPSFYVPTWVIVASAGAIALGVSLGGWRIIKTLGGKFYRVRPIHGFAAQASSASVILGAALLGGPVSTT